MTGFDYYMSWPDYLTFGRVDTYEEALALTDTDSVLATITNNKTGKTWARGEIPQDAVEYAAENGIKLPDTLLEEFPAHAP